ncbi:hypothetical protein CEP54_012623 [Fusarium duplospermum]|uniref:Uncharacterized protein n=1 Tax=Fusarium duplospermum TaxID=1325734 RepID=A0A428P7Q9_9HYPO|nr:hypothetical protein CEP54_012623 [Fusarium duplospermum]
MQSRELEARDCIGDDADCVKLCLSARVLRFLHKPVLVIAWLRVVVKDIEATDGNSVTSTCFIGYPGFNYDKEHISNTS